MYRQIEAATPPGQTISALSALGPAGVVGINDHPRGDNPQGCGQLAADPAPCTLEADPDVLVSFTSVEKEGVYLNGKQPGWSLQALQQILATGRYTLVFQDGYNWVVRKIPEPAGG